MLWSRSRNTGFGVRKSGFAVRHSHLHLSKPLNLSTPQFPHYCLLSKPVGRVRSNLLCKALRLVPAFGNSCSKRFLCAYWEPGNLIRCWVFKGPRQSSYPQESQYSGRADGHRSRALKYSMINATLEVFLDGETQPCLAGGGDRLTLSGEVLSEGDRALGTAPS